MNVTVLLYGPEMERVSTVQLNNLARGFLSPPAVLTAVWSIVLAVTLIGRIDDPSLPSISTFALITTGFYAALLRYAPGLADQMEIKRTPLLYLRYLGFFFGFLNPGPRTTGPGLGQRTRMISCGFVK